ncbi:MAG: T9SS type A sorting domain-containing protein, partial [Bacteroidales bacterium]|nr:T9SS type A sorting domain-containing protein [Bacteroidales bacterium]
GWWGSTNGWYRIKGSFNAGGYNYVTGGVLNILPSPMLDIPIIWDEAENTNLAWQYPDKAKAEAFEIQQNIDDNGWETISNTTTDTFLLIYPEVNQNYKYRIRAKTNGRWFNNWGEEIALLWNYTGINENNLGYTKVYPSPFSNQLNIEFENLNLSKIHIRIYNPQGTLVFKEDVLHQQTSNINTRSWRSGLYVVQLYDGKETSTTKVIKQ